MITTTLNRIRAHSPCTEGWAKSLRGLGKTRADDEPLPFARIVEVNGLGDALWCCRAEPQHARKWQLFAVWCARQVQHLLTEPSSLAAVDVAERYALGQATDAELSAARNDAHSACDAISKAIFTARPGGMASDAADDASLCAAYAVVWVTHDSTHFTALRAAYDAASAASWDAVRLNAIAMGENAASPDEVSEAAWLAAKFAQRAEFLRIVGGAE